MEMEREDLTTAEVNPWGETVCTQGRRQESVPAPSERSAEADRPDGDSAAATMDFPKAAADSSSAADAASSE